MQVEQALADLACAERLPADAIRASLDRPDAFVPAYLDILTRYARREPVGETEERALAVFVHILGELGDTRAFRPLMDLLASGNERVEDLLGDLLTETIPNILMATFDGDTERVYAMIADSEVDEFIRDSVFMLWTYLVLTGTIDRDEAHRYLEAFPEKAALPDDCHLWISWMDAVATLGLVELVGAVEAAFADGRIGIDAFGIRGLEIDDFHHMLSESLAAADREQWMRRNRYWPFEDTLGVLSHWHCYSEEYINRDRGTDPDLLQPDPILNPFRSVGRNDPCPCGSGKKYKKCCLQ